ncbi:DNA topoisomerase I, partial [Candidatus Roizmanbacteria bacterium]|nr:DNA topoisomerase I [Candidatus Roizmanbacteria bacterium]
MKQEAFRRFGFSSKMTMRIAQQLYERGLITYHRTDSFNLSTHFVFSAKSYIEKIFGEAFALPKPREYKTRSRMAQEAHEAIRPTNLDKNMSGSSEEKKFTSNHKKLYQLIFNRAVSTQMKEAEIKIVKIAIASSKGYSFETQLQQVLFPGFLKLLNPEFVEKHQTANTCKENERLTLKETTATESETLPPPRYNEASLIKSLEEKGIG